MCKKTIKIRKSLPIQQHLRYLQVQKEALQVLSAGTNSLQDTNNWLNKMWIRISCCWQTAAKFTKGILNRGQPIEDTQSTKPSSWYTTVGVRRQVEYKWRLHSEPWYHQPLLCSSLLFTFDCWKAFITEFSRSFSHNQQSAIHAGEMSHRNTWWNLGYHTHTHTDTHLHHASLHHHHHYHHHYQSGQWGNVHRSVWCYVCNLLRVWAVY